MVQASGINYIIRIILILNLVINGNILAEEEKHPTNIFKKQITNNKELIKLSQDYQILSPKLFKCKDNYLIIISLFSENDLDTFSKIINIDRKGNILWEKILGRKATDNWISKVICPTLSQKYFILLGTVNYKPYYGGRGSGWIIMIDKNGKVIWDKEIKEAAVSYIKDGLINENGFILIVGNAYSGKEEETFKYSFLKEVNTNGRVLSSKNFSKKINFIEKLSSNEFLIGDFSNWRDSFLGVIDNRGNLIRYREYKDFSISPEFTKVITSEEKIFVIYLLEKEKLLVEVLTLGNLDKPLARKIFHIKNLCSIFNYEKLDDKRIIFSGIDCNNNLKIKVLELSLTKNTLDVKLIKETNLKPIVNNGNISDASYNGDTAIGTLDDSVIWFYTK